MQTPDINETNNQDISYSTIDEENSFHKDPFDPDKYKVISSVKIADHPGHDYGTIAEVYSYDNKPPKLRLLRYGTKDNSKYRRRLMTLAKPEAMRRVANFLNALADAFEDRKYKI